MMKDKVEGALEGFFCIPNEIVLINEYETKIPFDFKLFKMCETQLMCLNWSSKGKVKKDRRDKSVRRNMIGCWKCVVANKVCIVEVERWWACLTFNEGEIIEFWYGEKVE